jgi:hypothetical protein
LESPSRWNFVEKEVGMNMARWIIVGGAFLGAAVVSAKGAGITDLSRSHGKSIRVGSAYAAGATGYKRSRYSSGGGYSSFGN